MASFNKVLIMGRLTRDPELRYTPSNTPVADFGFAMSEVFKNKAGETVEQTCFVDVVVWGRQAETANEFLKKGSPAFIEGRLQFEQWETQQGEKRNKMVRPAVQTRIHARGRSATKGSSCCRCKKKTATSPGVIDTTCLLAEPS